MSLIYISREMVIQWGCSGDFTSNPKYIVVYIYIVIMWVCLKIGDYNPQITDAMGHPIFRPQRCSAVSAGNACVSCDVSPAGI